MSLFTTCHLTAKCHVDNEQHYTKGFRFVLPVKYPRSLYSLSLVLVSQVLVLSTKASDQPSKSNFQIVREITKRVTLCVRHVPVASNAAGWTVEQSRMRHTLTCPDLQRMT
ncbi:hypothetical protein M8J76_012527 [Diaphorina citri]|nr:hypothetical protein M8J76_012527 [Diaphorina citri]